MNGMTMTDMKVPADECLIMHCLNILMLKKKKCVSLTPILKTEKNNVQKWRSLSKIMVALTACFWVWEQTGIWYLMNQAVMYISGHIAHYGWVADTDICIQI